MRTMIDPDSTKQKPPTLPPVVLIMLFIENVKEIAKLVIDGEEA